MGTKNSCKTAAVMGLIGRGPAAETAPLEKGDTTDLTRTPEIIYGLLIRPAASQRELTAEGDALHHCVGTYGEGHAEGRTAIFFIRRMARPREPYFTLELDEKKLEVRQNRGLRNCVRTPEVEAFEREWLAWVRAGAPRDRNRRPVRVDQMAKKNREKGAA